MEEFVDSVYIPRSYNHDTGTSTNDQQCISGGASSQGNRDAGAVKDQGPERPEKGVRRYRGLRYVPGSVLCNICWKYIKEDVLTDHIATRHSGQNNQHMCEDCGKSYRFESTLVLHRAKRHGGAPPGTLQDKMRVRSRVTCTICQRTFDFKCRLMKHMEGHLKTWSFVYRCVVCLEQFETIDGLQNHAESHDEDVLNCALCGLQLNGADGILRHAQDHKEQEQTPYLENATEENEEDSNEQESISAQDVSEENEDGANADKQDGVNRDRLKCDVCGKLFHFASSLVSHMRLHKATQTLKCHRCFEMYYGIKALRLHLKKCDAPDPEADPPGTIPKKKRHRCDICHEKFLTYHGCQTHRLVHTGEPKPHQCPVCGKRFTLRGQLRKHSVSHMEVSPHVCEFCGRSFLRREGLKYHRMIHTGERPSLCDICGKGFVSREKLRLHRFVHTRETPFNCKVCGRGFRAFVTRQKHKCEGPPQETLSEPQLLTEPEFI